MHQEMEQPLHQHQTHHSHENPPRPDQHHPPRHDVRHQSPRLEPHHHKHPRLHLIRRRTHPIAWLGAVLCALFWIIIILGGLAVVIIYLAFRPRTPRFDISTATLNAAYLDTGSLLNADLTILANISNPNKKIDISFDSFGVDLYYGKTLIAVTSVGPFSERRLEAKLGNFHLVASLVQLPVKDILRLKNELLNNTVSFEVKGAFKRSHWGGNFLHFSYWLFGHCSIVVSGPPSGVLQSSYCNTKR